MFRFFDDFTINTAKYAELATCFLFCNKMKSLGKNTTYAHYLLRNHENANFAFFRTLNTSQPNQKSVPNLSRDDQTT